ncbi:hypothetical protein LINGRAHAP2_LOCUS26926 [Linum grandiflorum]
MKLNYLTLSIPFHQTQNFQGKPKPRIIIIKKMVYILLKIRGGCSVDPKLTMKLTSTIFQVTRNTGSVSY